MSHLFSTAARRALRFSISSSRTASRSSLFSPSLIHPRLPPAAALRTFASKPRASADDRLQRVLQDEISHADTLDHLDKKTLIPDDFPFEIVDNSGEQMITLKRNVSGENIVVEAYMPDMNEDDEEDGSEDDGKDANVDADADVIFVPLSVKIDKGDDTYLEFTCTASSKGIVIESMNLKSHQASAVALYEGPQFGDLDEALQQAAHTYLEDRGIDSSLSDFLEKYMIHKDDREYRDWLKNIKDFVTK